MTIDPVLILDKQEVQELLIAMGADRNYSFDSSQYMQQITRSKRGADIIGVMQGIVRRDE